jgi:hypothetical protein
MLEDLVSGRRRREFLDKNGQWKWAAIRKYLKLVKRFEELLLLLAHFTGGQPSRGERLPVYASLMASIGTGMSLLLMERWCSSLSTINPWLISTPLRLSHASCPSGQVS